MKNLYLLFAAVFMAPGFIYAQPVNDDCSGALPIEINGAAVIADNTDATYYGPMGSCLYGDQTDGNVYFTFTLTEAGILSIQTEEGTSTDSQLTLFTIEDCGGGAEAFTEIACNDDISFFSAMSEILTDELEPGTYYLAASTFSSEAQEITNVGTYSITVSSAVLPENNSCEGAVELILDGDAEIADNSVSTMVGPEGSCYNVAQEVGDTWFVFTIAETTSVLVFTEEGESIDSQVSVFTIEGCGTGNEVYTEVGCNDDASDDNYMSIIQLIDLPAGTYYIKAGTYSSFFTGSYSISIETLTMVNVNEADKNASFTVYPNPNSGDFSIANAGVSGNYGIELIDLTGRIVYEKTAVLNANTETNVSVKGIAPGVYMIRMVNDKDNSFTTQRIVVK